MQALQHSETVTVKGTIVDKKKKMGWVTVDEPGVPRLVAKQDLSINGTYQRTMVSPLRVSQIRQTWSWVACGSLIVAERDGKLWVIDGQHRVAAAMNRSDIKELPCLVFQSQSTEHEALAFWRANCVRGAVTPYDRLRALVVANDQVAVNAVHLMESTGYKPGSGGNVNHSVRCISTFLGTMRTNSELLTRLWPLISNLHNPLSIRTSVFEALVFIGKYGTEDISDKVWQQRILRQGLHKIEHAIDRAKAAFSSKGGAKVGAIATIDVINSGVRGKRIKLDEDLNAED